MDKIIGVTEFQRKFRAVFDEVAKKNTAYILTRGSRPEAVMIPYEKYREFLQSNADEILFRFDRLRQRMAELNARYTDEEVEEDLREAHQQIRSRKR
jgi:prevent-host-death family protein